jgi:hypothetical protein
MAFGTMKRTYSIVSIDGNTGKRLHEFLTTHKSEYPSVISFVDAAVNEKLIFEEKKTIPEKIEYEKHDEEQKTNMEELNQMNPYINGGGL